MRLGLLFSGGKDSTYAGFLANKEGYDLACLISIYSENKDSFMFHTPSIDKTKKQAEVMNIPLIIQETKGKKEDELKDLEKAIRKAKEECDIEGVVTGAIESVYQASRVQKICDKLNLECFNPLWQKDELEYLNELVRERFEVIIVSVAAYPLDKKWLGRKIDKKFISEVRELKDKFKIHPAGEGGEFETFVIDCPLFKRGLKIKDKKISGEKNSWRMEIEIE
ncbi:MAG: diphthine--ammonia ligase [Candidatus Pacearchaeota archaeon]|nr:diphthine--ammonia ligase [Candidatus Pacearchaeota archaeon]